MSASHVHRLIVGVSQVKINRSQCNAAAWNIVHYVAAVLMGQNAAVATVDGDASEAGSAACWAQHLVICQRGGMQVYAMVRAQIQGPCVMRVSQGVPKTGEVVQGRIFTAVWPQTQQ